MFGTTDFIAFVVAASSCLVTAYANLNITVIINTIGIAAFKILIINTI